MYGKLRRRYARHGGSARLNLHMPVLLIGANLVLLAVLLLDQPVSASVLHSGSMLRQIGAVVTDVGKSDWLIFAGVLLLFEALSVSRLTRSVSARCQALHVGQLAAYLLATVIVSGLVANLAKRLIGRVRPLYQDETGIFGFSPLHGGFQFESFPSGHSTTVGAVLMAIALIAPRYRALCLVMAIWLGISRVVVAAHYPSDVIAGLTLGAWSSILLAVLFARHGILFRDQGTALPVLRRTFPLALPKPAVTGAKPAVSPDHREDGGALSAAA
ncbi:phosphatase PAP2 family protein [Affinirhizobium pseudoryzae]|jgi:undecaprenyl-diphosphatase|uniref:phosphatase PAP2 family protein n=1 Tax=Allorhizobium pseudoryzae TaxID=379684 RepID=UPI0019D1673F|nr:phosphatase PAP2 family protein [Allorhizobium pseudoryzae]